MSYIADSRDQIRLPNQPGLLEWLQEHYPHSRYRLVTDNTDNCQDSNV